MEIVRSSSRIRLQYLSVFPLETICLSFSDALMQHRGYNSALHTPRKLYIFLLEFVDRMLYSRQNSTRPLLDIISKVLSSLPPFYRGAQPQINRTHLSLATVFI